MINKLVGLSLVLGLVGCGQEPNSSSSLGSSESIRTIVFDSGQINVALPDRATVEYPMNLDDSAYVGGVTCEVNIQHTYSGDLIISLISPEGTEIIMRNGVGGGTDDINDTYNEETIGVDFTPLFGQPISGEWKLKIHDRLSQDFGELQHVKLTLERV